MAERKLGRGLDSLLGESGASPGEQVVHLPVAELRPGPHQPRQDFAQDHLDELAASIRESGVLQPILVRPGAVGYEIVAGERRVRAARLAGLEEVPALLRAYDDDQVMLLSLVENVQRRDLNPIDRAQAYKRLVQRLGVTHEEAARRLGLERSSVSNMIRLLELPDEVRELVAGGALTMGHARALLALEDELDQLKMAERVIKEGLSVRAVESHVRTGGPVAPRRRSNPRKTPEVAALEGELRNLLGTKVTIRDRRGKGRIEVEYFSTDEFGRILDLLRGLREERGFGYGHA